MAWGGSRQDERRVRNCGTGTGQVVDEGRPCNGATGKGGKRLGRDGAGRAAGKERWDGTSSGDKKPRTGSGERVGAGRGKAARGGRWMRSRGQGE